MLEYRVTASGAATGAYRFAAKELDSWQPRLFIDFVVSPVSAVSSSTNRLIRLSFPSRMSNCRRLGRSCITALRLPAGRHHDRPSCSDKKRRS